MAYCNQLWVHQKGHRMTKSMYSRLAYILMVFLDSYWLPDKWPPETTGAKNHFATMLKRFSPVVGLVSSQ
ncbi:hypothetical protein AUP44_05175 [Tistrella mobilis]|uniref:Uncharacterized protein n=1 Tax=Tistrella mobilis TaxID=171437 RepID=A0A162KXD2_9PROT|nr:hypothetical protein AUP44_05175 [Tistrella mobilis]